MNNYETNWMEIIPKLEVGKEYWLFQIRYGKLKFIINYKPFPITLLSKPTKVNENGHYWIGDITWDFKKNSKYKELQRTDSWIHGAIICETEEEANEFYNKQLESTIYHLKLNPKKYNVEEIKNSIRKHKISKQ